MAQTLPRPATALSVIGHAIFLALLSIEAPRHLMVTQQQVTAIEVVMVAQPERQPEPTPAPSPATQPQIGRQPSPPRTSRPSESARIAATEYFASAVLDDPRNKDTRRKLATLGSDERLIQLCNIEAMEQLKRWKAGFVPDHVVAYATADPSVTASSIDAPGAAVHADGKWYRLSFNCSVGTDFERVEGFAFTLGRLIPQTEWERDSLPELVDGDPTD